MFFSYHTFWSSNADNTELFDQLCVSCLGETYNQDQQDFIKSISKKI